MRWHWLVILMVWMVGCADEPQEEPIPPLCTAGQTQCAEDGKGVEQCAQDGQSFQPLTTCIEGAYCDESICRCPPEMVMGSQECLLPGVRECPASAALQDHRCVPQPGQCKAGEIWAGGQCSFVGTESCPAPGWSREEETGGCLPDLAECGDSEHAVIGAGCTTVGPQLSCGDLDDPYGPFPAGQELVFVLEASPAAPEEQDGSQDKPFSTLAPAVAAATAGGTVVVGKGTYAGGVEIDKSLTLLGKCAEYVTIDGALPYPHPTSEFPVPLVIHVSGAENVELAGFTLTDSASPEEARGSGLLVDSADSVSIHDVAFVGLGGAAIDLHRPGQATLAGILVDGLRYQTGVTPYGQIAYGLRATEPGTLEVKRSRFVSTQGADIRVTDGCPSILDSLFEKRGAPGGLQPLGIWIAGCKDGTTTVEGCSFLSKMTHALLVEGGTVEARRNVFKGTVTDYDDNMGPAVKLSDSQFLVEENYFLENQYAGFSAQSSSGAFLANRVEANLPSDPGLKNGDGMILKDCNKEPVIIRDNTFLKNTRNSILMSASSATIVNNVVLETLKSQSPNAATGAGANVVEGSDAAITGNVFSGHYWSAIRFDDSYGSVVGNVVTGTLPDDEGRCGGSIIAGGKNGSILADGIRLNLVTDGTCAGILVTNSTVNMISGNLVQGIVGKKGTLGVGVVISGAKCSVEENWIRDNTDSGMLFESTAGSLRNNVFENNGTKGKGGGLVVQEAVDPTVNVETNTFVGNGFANLIVRASKVKLAGNSLLSSVPNAGGSGGAAIWMEEGCSGEVRESYIKEALLAGILLLGSKDVDLKVNFIADTDQGSLPRPGGIPLHMADGIAVSADSVASCLYNRVERSAMAGIAYFESTGVLTGNLLANNGTYGIELSNSAVTLETNVMSGNQSGNLTESGDRVGPASPLGKWVVCKED